MTKVINDLDLVTMVEQGLEDFVGTLDLRNENEPDTKVWELGEYLFESGFSFEYSQGTNPGFYDFNIRRNQNA